MAAGSNKDCMHHSALAMLAKSIAKQDKSQTASKTNEWSSARHVGLQDNVLHSVGRFALSAPNHQCGTYILCHGRKLGKAVNIGPILAISIQIEQKLRICCHFGLVHNTCDDGSGEVPGTSGDLRGNPVGFRASSRDLRGPPGKLHVASRKPPNYHLAVMFCGTQSIWLNLV